MIRAKALEITTFDGVPYWTPFQEFSNRETHLLDAWEAHYQKLGIKTKFRNRRLWIKVSDDRHVYPRELGIMV